jgi:hypothetical protein
MGKATRLRTILYLFALPLPVIGPLSPQPAFGQCTVQERVELGRQGYSRQDIDRLCGSPAQQSPPPGARPPLASTCVTARGVCQTVAPVDAGQPCTCVFPAGAFPGVAR